MNFKNEYDKKQHEDIHVPISYLLVYWNIICVFIAQIIWKKGNEMTSSHVPISIYYTMY